MYHFNLSSESQGLIYSDSEKFVSSFCVRFSNECSSRTNIDRELEMIRGERQFYVDYQEIVSFYNSRTEKQAVDEIMRKTCTKTLNFHDFC